MYTSIYFGNGDNLTSFPPFVSLSFPYLAFFLQPMIYIQYYKGVGIVDLPVLLLTSMGFLQASPFRMMLTVFFSYIAYMEVFWGMLPMALPPSRLLL